MRVAALLALLALGACGYSVDAEQARLCRLALPALNDAGARLAVQRVAPGPRGGPSVRIDYAVERADRSPLQRRLTCTFAGSGLAGRKGELTALETERGPVSGASLHLMKRHYLETPDALAAAPADIPARAPEAPRWAVDGVQQAAAALPRMIIYGLLAAAYALVFGLVGRINLAFGELAALGGAATVSGVGLALAAGLRAPLEGLALGLGAALFAAALHGVVGGLATLRPGRATGGEARENGSQADGTRATLIATVGLSLALMEYLRLTQSAVTVWIPPVWSHAIPLLQAGDFVATVTPRALLVAAIGLAAGGGTLRLMRASRFGRAWRAYADDPGAAALCGVDGERLLVRTLALSGALAGLAGFLVVAYYGGLGFAGGFQLGLKALIAAVLGGIGSVGGALLGGMTIAAFETAWSALMPIEGRDVALYACLILVLVFRPGGFFGDRDRQPRPV